MSPVKPPLASPAPLLPSLGEPVAVPASPAQAASTPKLVDGLQALDALQLWSTRRMRTACLTLPLRAVQPG